MQNKNKKNAQGATSSNAKVTVKIRTTQRQKFR
jgi:hypothetical protein